MKTPLAYTLFCAGLAFTMVATAAEPPSTPTTGYDQGMKVAIDPATGRIRTPTAEEIQQLRATVAPARSSLAPIAPATAAEARQTIQLTATGAVMAQVPEELMSAMVATRRADGSLQVGHAADTDAVLHTQEQTHE